MPGDLGRWEWGGKDRAGACLTWRSHPTEGPSLFRSRKGHSSWSSAQQSHGCPPAAVAEGAWLFASGFPTGRSPVGCPAAAHSLTPLLLDPTAGKIWSGKTLLPARWEPARVQCVPGSRFKPTDSCGVRTVTLLCRNASRCFIGTLDFGVAVLNWFILLNYQVMTYYYTQNTKAENIYAPHNSLKYSLKLKCQWVLTCISVSLLPCSVSREKCMEKLSRRWSSLT